MALSIEISSKITTLRNASDFVYIKVVAGIIERNKANIKSIWDLVQVNYPVKEHEKLERDFHDRVFDEKGLPRIDTQLSDLACENQANQESSIWSDIKWQTWSSLILPHFDELVDLETLSLDALENIYGEILEFSFWPDDAETVDEILDSLPPDVFEASEIQMVLNLFQRIEGLIKMCQSVQGIERANVILEWAQSGKQPGFIYLLRSSSGYWKIGLTSAPENRRKTFDVKLPFEIAYEHLIPTNEMKKAETWLHRKFANKRVNGEWFNLSPEDVEWIKGLTQLNL